MNAKPFNALSEHHGAMIPEVIPLEHLIEAFKKWKESSERLDAFVTELEGMALEKAKTASAVGSQAVSESPQERN